MRQIQKNKSGDRGDKLLNSQMRLVSLYAKLMNGEVVKKDEEAARFGVDRRTIQRDIESLRDYFFNSEDMDEYGKTIVYKRQLNGYVLEETGENQLTEAEIYAVCKILLESRALRKTEMEPILKKLLLNCTVDSGRRKVKELIANESYHYIELQHKKPLLDMIWKIAGAITEQRYLEVEYVKMNKEKVVRTIRPAGIMFSEFYFYMVGFLDDKELRKQFDNPDDPFPTIYRIDRMESVKVLDEKFHIFYKNRFEEGEFRKRIQFMYGGKLKQVTFKYSGDSIEAVLDRLPTAEIIEENDEGYIIQAEVFGDGIYTWLCSQGEKVKSLMICNK